MAAINEDRRLHPADTDAQRARRLAPPMGLSATHIRKLIRGAKEMQDDGQTASNTFGRIAPKLGMPRWVPTLRGWAFLGTPQVRAWAWLGIGTSGHHDQVL
jgi:hypothetical protein